jgi:hypothetical protein
MPVFGVSLTDDSGLKVIIYVCNMFIILATGVAFRKISYGILSSIVRTFLH